MRPYRSILAILSLGLISLGATEVTVAESNKPNVLLISIDTLRADSLGVYGCPKNTTPAIDHFSTQGTLFEYAIAQRGSTWPSLVSLHTSLYPVQHGVRKNGGIPDKNARHLAQILSTEGYECNAYIANAKRAEWHGFDKVVGFTFKNTPTPKDEIKQLPNFKLEHGVREVDRDGRVTELGLQFLKSAGDEPFFLWLHYVMPHRPFGIPKSYKTVKTLFGDPDYDGDIASALLSAQFEGSELPKADLDHVRNLYYRAVRVDDDYVRQVLAQLERSGLAENTVVILTADHGENLFERAHHYGHSASIHEGVLRVPLIIRYPDAVPAGKRVSDVVELIDVAPTILEILGLPIPKAYQGKSLMPAMRGNSVGLGPAFSEWEDKVLAVRTDRYRFVLNPLGHHPEIIGMANLKAAGLDRHPGYIIEKEELFQIQDDPDELNNLAASKPELVKAFREQLIQWQKDMGWILNGAEEIEISDEVKEELEALGYIL